MKNSSNSKVLKGNKQGVKSPYKLSKVKTSAKSNKPNLTIVGVSKDIFSGPVMADKITFNRSITKKQAEDIIKESYSEFKDSQSDWTPVYKKKNHSMSAKIRVPNVNGEVYETDPHIFVQVTKYGYNGPSLRIEYNPTKIPMSKLGSVNTDFMALIGLTFIEIIAQANISNIHFCVDIYNADINDLIIRAKKFRTSCVYYEAGNVQTINFGKFSGNQYTAYNKAAEETKNPSPAYFKTRLECKLRTKKLKLADLPHFKNPFLRFEVSSVSAKDHPKGMCIGHWKAFQASARSLGGVNQALKNQPKKWHYKIKKTLKHNNSDFWQPQDIWDKTAAKAMQECFIDANTV